METVFSVGSDPRLYDEDPRPAEGIIESAVEDDREEMATS
jgi:hypothetical protein